MAIQLRVRLNHIPACLTYYTNAMQLLLYVREQRKGKEFCVLKKN
jgi:hypothetical protein